VRWSNTLATAGESSRAWAALIVSAARVLPTNMKNVTTMAKYKRQHIMQRTC
jgi:hypothetical protein